MSLFPRELTYWIPLQDITSTIHIKGVPNFESPIGIVHIISIERADRSGECFNFRGHTLDSDKTSNRFVAYFDYKKSMGFVRFENSIDDPDHLRFGLN